MRAGTKAIDTRLADYFDDLVHQPDLHNGYEILGAVKFLRLLRTYHFNERRVQQIIQLREGNWEPDEQGRNALCIRRHQVPWYRQRPCVSLATIPGVCSGISFGFYHWLTPGRNRRS